MGQISWPKVKSPLTMDEAILDMTKTVCKHLRGQVKYYRKTTNMVTPSAASEGKHRGRGEEVTCCVTCQKILENCAVCSDDSDNLKHLCEKTHCLSILNYLLLFNHNFTSYRLILLHILNV